MEKNLQIPIIPRPADMTQAQGVFLLDETTRIKAAPDLEGIAGYLLDVLRSRTGLSLRVGNSPQENDSTNAILLVASSTNADLGDEGYDLEVAPQTITIRGRTPAGVFYGIQTLRQLIRRSQNRGQPEWTIPGISVVDYPRFPWRGMHLDVARHMFSTDFIKRYIDLLALHKMNVFHWHLTDDQGWRIEIKKYPRLTSVGSWRTATPLPTNRLVSDSVPYGGYYSQEQIKEIVAYAASRHVTVVPEIEMPGHALAALASYPYLGCTGGPYQVGSSWGVFEDVFCAGDEGVYTFLEHVLSEVIDLFPGEYIHIGGDECPKERWNECPKCQAMMASHRLGDARALQSYFIKRISKFLADKGRRLIGWDEILEGGLASGATVMLWRDVDDAVAAVNMGHDVIMCPMGYCYFDYYQSKEVENEPPAIGGYVPIEKVYDYEPIPSTLSDREAAHILGGQGNLWTEYIPTPEQVLYMAYPRGTALAEALWSPLKVRDYNDFRSRLRVFLGEWKEETADYCDPFSEGHIAA